ncbi:MAG: translation initiation factor IF-2 [Patescibacteria group bacterium]|jgi:translation initiation factor IF-2
MAKSTSASPKTDKPAKKPPVVVVLGHVDHGKTTLLDTIRKTNVAAGETGGITQHIGAYQVQTKENDPSSKITFIDTPGHEAFSKMRSRGANVADLAILVVAGNDGVKPQTKEAIQHIKKANIPFLVAINKVDLEGVNLDVVKSQLAENEVIVEDYGGDVVSVPISAKTGKGVPQLLEMLELLYELQNERQTKDELEAIVMESYVDPHRGVIVNVLVRSGELRVGDTLYCQKNECRVRSLLNENGKQIERAGVNQPAQVLGFKEVLPVGMVVTNAPLSEKFLVETEKPATTEVPEEEQKKLKIILKTDVAGTLEAIKANLTEEVDLLDEGIGDISESDILLARSTGARIIGFRVKVPTSVKKLAEMEEVRIQTFDVIYHLLEDIQDRVLKLIEPKINEEILGKAEIIAEFKIKGSHIAGCKVIEGTVVRSERVKVLREDKTMGDAKIAAMQIERQDVKEAKKGQEVALVFRPDISFKIGDIVESYKVVKD